ncbi:PREDICTED: high affinity cAMP-specific and IBMX-insensitive 3',5'-cyclic phosphodiesterase 8A isoform X1 [Polistes canadensis]|uniref:high affinity cAMP-specific and IBMX-insensitive 3',5'-cyclic phosphodiesterase 8A isoform X1 n=1 Tax=Polistes canadensis TaxID=91411 RepID=UPI000718CAC9|nr:PREDICTED: high affinity cAMP-specific and IBMX-insensitive 3',5'-cyclic phosphodiesterase 8A isoform X1 [Polistes canadensis]
MGCKSSALKCMGLKRNPESHNRAKLDAKSSTIDTDAQEFPREQDSGHFTLDLKDFFCPEDPYEELQRTDMYDIVAEKETLEEIRRSLEEDADYPVIKGPQDINSHLLTSSAPGLIKILLVFSKDDQQMEILANISGRLGWSVSVAKDTEKAVEIFQTRGHELVIIDHRGQRAVEGDAICRAIKSSPVYHSSVIVALVKKSYLMNSEKDEIVTLDLLEKGFSRTLMECSNEGILINELVGIYTSSVLPKTQLASAHALYLALDRCHDMVHITNERNIVQFVNKVSEKLLGYKTEELTGRNLGEIVHYENFTLMEQQLSKGREFEGNMNCKRKNNQMITINCRIIPFCITPKKATHFIYIYDTLYLLENSGPLSPINNSSSMQRMSLLSGRKSSDVKSALSDGHRRSSLQKLHSLQLEAPITKVITLLSYAISESTNPETVAQIDKAIEILKTTELYVPHFRDDKVYTDPVATDLVGALLSSSRNPWDSRRSSADSARLSAVRGISIISARTPLKAYRGPQEIMELLENSLEWNFDIFKLEVLTEKRPLLYLGRTIMNMFDVPSRLGCDENIIQNWLSIIEANYRSDNSYHNSTHAADVMQATARFMQSERLKQILEPLDEVAALIAAAAHDIDHPGRSSQFLSNSNNKLAILYNDLSVLESHHAALTFKISLADDKVNIFKNLDRDTYKKLRTDIIDMILATEMTKHFEHLAKFMNVCSLRVEEDQPMKYSSDRVDNAILLQPDNVILVRRMMIKCADVSNPTRPLRACVEWARRIAEEYFSQTDEEKQLKIPIVMPMFDRMICSIPKSQIGFIDFIINDMIEAWDAFIDMPEILGYTQHNYDKWKEFNDQGVTTLQDIEKIQMQSEYSIPRLPDERR